MRDVVIYLIVVPVALAVGMLIGFLVTRYFFKKQVKEWQKKMEKPDKEQVRNMLSALGKKPSEEQVNRFINMAKGAEKKKDQEPKKSSPKRKKQ
jgi:uncharacterized protein YneF (UPF0154 family)